MGKKNLLLILVMLICISQVFAATISGTVYTLNLEKAKDAIVIVYSSPRQFIVAKDGDYSFEVSPGEYNIEAYLQDKNSKAIVNPL